MLIELDNNLLEDFGTLTNLTQIERLNLSGNRIKTLPILNLPKIKFLDVSNNQLADTLGIWKNLSNSVDGLKSTLMELYLTNNRYGIHPTSRPTFCFLHGQADPTHLFCFLLLVSDPQFWF